MKKKKKDVDDEMSRMVQALRVRIKSSGKTRQEVAEGAGIKLGVLGTILSEQKALRVIELLSILKTIEVPPKEFFQEFYAFSISFDKLLDSSGLDDATLRRFRALLLRDGEEGEEA